MYKQIEIIEGETDPNVVKRVVNASLRRISKKVRDPSKIKISFQVVSHRDRMYYTYTIEYEVDENEEPEISLV